MIRERRRRDDSDANLFGRWWETVNTDIRAARVREISAATAERVILDYEWLGTMPAIVWHSFGIYFDGHLGGVVTYSPEYSENLGTWDRYDFTGRMILLSRGACVHWAHPHAGSKLIRQSMRLLPPCHEIITATVDAAAGEVGTIYQACGFDYVGVMSQGGRCTAVVNGERLQSRQIRRRFGGYEQARAHGVVLESVGRKARYFGFRGPLANQHRATIAHLIKPYPKRAVTPGADSQGAE